MKCPKCGYLGFEDADRCRNCGYEFLLSAPATMRELPLRIEESDNSGADDLILAEAFSAQSFRSTPQPAASTELSLVFEAEPDDEPLIKHPSPPRTPLAVRRSTPEPPRVRAEQPRLQALDLPAEAAPVRERPSAPITAAPRAHTPDREPVAAGIPARIIAVVIDVMILAAVDALVVYFTLQICNLTTADLALLPRGPLIAFLLVQNGGYLVVFTAGGQTLGKMAAGIRVIPASPDDSLDVGQAFVRELLWVLLAVPAGLGFVSALFSSDRRGLHDRLAGTRVVR